MAYYGQGDYYRGDYYRGDPGLLGFLGRAAKGFITGGPLGLVSSVGGQLLKRVIGHPAAALAEPATVPAPVMRMARNAFGPFIGPGAVRNAMQGTALAPAQFDTSGTFKGVRGGSSSTALVLNEKTGLYHHHRKHMNVANPRALRRALRRVAGFGKLAKRAKRDIARAASAIGVHRTVRRASPFARKR